MKILALVAASLGGLAVLAGLVVAALWLHALLVNAFFARPIDTAEDLPWVAPGRQARYFGKRVVDWNRGAAAGDRVWGEGAWRGKTPVETAFAAFAFLESRRAMAAWEPASPEGGGTFTTYSVDDALLPGDRHETDGYGNVVVTYTRRIAPYRFFIVSIQPTVVVMLAAPDVVEQWREHVRRGYPQDDLWTAWVRGLAAVETQWLRNPIEYGTRLPKGRDWQWFSPELGQPPAPLPLSRTRTVTVPIGSSRLSFHPVAGGWQVTRE